MVYKSYYQAKLEVGTIKSAGGFEMSFCTTLNFQLSIFTLLRPFARILTGKLRGMLGNASNV